MTARLRSLLCGAAWAVLGAAALAQAGDDFSPAERALFMSRHFGAVKPPLTLRYSYARTGSAEEGFKDRVTLSLAARSDGRCCTARADFLNGTRRLQLPEIDDPQGNPVLLHFLERDIAEMKRLTQGSSSYFRKRIRIGVHEAAQLSEVRFSFRGRSVQGRQFVVRPYVDDPLRERFEKYIGKEYLFMLSDAVPGTVAMLRTRVPASEAGAAPLSQEELRLDGVAMPEESRK